MTGQWLEFVADNLGALSADKSDEALSLIALFELQSEYEAGGLIQYLMNGSGDSILDVKRVFEMTSFHDGLDWLRDLDRVFGRAVPVRRGLRIDLISKMPGYDQGIDPFDVQDRELGRLLPFVDSIAESLALSVQREWSAASQ